jgi:pyruvate dehydrogenase E2 component (dihydrolipoamide acetyltransferase)
MPEAIEIRVPDIGGAKQVDVIEVLVKPGDMIVENTSLITLESDKASMEIPSPKAGKVASLNVKVGDKLSEGDVILMLVEDGAEIKSSNSEPKIEPEVKVEVEKPEVSKSVENATSEQEVLVPDIGGAKDVDVIEIMVKPGDTIKLDQSLITLEGDKATMEIPSPAEGVVQNVHIRVGDKVSQNSLILTVLSSSPVSVPQVQKQETQEDNAKQSEVHVTKEVPIQQNTTPQVYNDTDGFVSASPAIRRMARELGVQLSQVKGSGRKERITKEDVQSFVKNALNQPKSTSGFSMPTAPEVDFSKFGGIESKPLNKIKRMTGVNVHRSWITIPHVTQFDEADITELESFRKAESEAQKNASYKLTILAFVCKVVSNALAKFPQFNTSLDSSGENLIYKQYCNIGIAVETPNGLVVPVIKAVDTLSVSQIASEMARLSAKAREKGLMPADMSGGCFTISSLGGIGGTAFTPIVNSPEVAILGLSRSQIRPVYDGKNFQPRLMLPLSLSYDHRVIDGAEAARFTRYLAECLGDIRRILI